MTWSFAITKEVYFIFLTQQDSHYFNNSNSKILYPYFGAFDKFILVFFPMIGLKTQQKLVCFIFHKVEQQVSEII